MDFYGKGSYRFGGHPRHFHRLPAASQNLDSDPGCGHRPLGKKYGLDGLHMAAKDGDGELFKFG